MSFGGDLGEVRGRIVIDNSQAQQAISQTAAQTAALTSGQAAASAAGTSAAGRFGAAWKSASVGMALAGGAIVAGIKSAAGAYIDFDRQMHNVQSIGGQTDAQLKELNQSVLDMAVATGQGPSVLAEALYNVYSSGFAGAEALDIVQAGAVAANAGLTDAATSTAALTAVLNSYGEGAYTASDASDILFKTVDLGVVSYEELASTIGATLPVAESMGVSLEEVGAATALMTRHGISAARTQVDLQALMRTGLKPTKALSDAFQDAFGESAQARLEKGGIKGYLEDIYKVSGGDESKMAKLLGTSQALTAALILGADGGADYVEMLNDMEDSAGATEKAMSQQEKSLGFSLQRMGAALDVVKIKLAEGLAPAAHALASVITTLAGIFANLPAPVLQVIAIFTALVGAVFSVMGALGLITTFLGGGAFLAFAAGIVAAVGLVIAAFLTLKKLFTSDAFGIGGAVDELAGKIGRITDAFMHAYKTGKAPIALYAGLPGIFKTAARAAQDFGIALNKGVKQWKVLRKNGIDPVTAAFKASGTTLQNLRNSKFIPFASTLGKVGDALVKTAKFTQGLRTTFDTFIKTGASPLQAVFGTIGVGIAQLSDHFGIFKDAGQSLATAFLEVGEAFTDVGDAVQALLKLDFKEFKQEAGDAFEHIGNAVSALGDAVKSGLSALGGFLSGVDWYGIAQGAYDLLAGAIGAIDWAGVWGFVKDVFSAGIDLGEAVLNFGAKLGGKLAEVAGNLWGWVKDQLGVGGTGAGGLTAGGHQAGPSNTITIGDVFLDGAAQLGSALKTVASNVYGWIKDKIPKVGSAAVDLGNVLLDGAAKLGSALQSVASNVYGWIKNKIPKVGSAAVDLGDVLMDGAAKLGPALQTVADSVHDWINDKIPDVTDPVDIGTVNLDGTADGTSITEKLKAVVDNIVLDVQGFFANHVDDIKAAVGTLFNFEIGGDLGSTLGTKLGNFLDGLDWSGLFGMLLTIQGKLMEGLAAVVVGAVVLLAGIAGQLLTFIGTFFIALFGALFDAPDDMVQTVGDGLQGVIQSASDWLADNLNDVGASIAGAITGAIAKGIEDLKGFASNIADKIKSELQQAVMTLGPNTMTSIFGPLPAKIGTAIVEGIQNMPNFAANIADRIHQEFNEMVGVLDLSDIASAIVGKLFDAIRAVPGGGWVLDQLDLDKEQPEAEREAHDAGTKVNEALHRGLAGDATTGKNDFSALFKSITDPMKEMAVQATTSGTEVSTAMTAMGTSVGIAVTSITSNVALIDPVLVTTSSAFTTASSTILTAMVNMGVAVGTAVSSITSNLARIPPVTVTVNTAFTTMQSSSSSSAQTMQSNVSSSMNTMASNGTQAMQKFATAVKDGFRQAADAAQNGVNAIKNAVASVGSLYSQGYSIGQSFGQGVAAGLSSMLAEVAAASAAIVSAAANAATAKAEINSPSHLFAREVGAPIVEGIIYGVDRNSRQLTDSMKSAIGNAIPSLNGLRTPTLPASNNFAVTVKVETPEQWQQTVDWVGSLGRSRGVSISAMGVQS